MEKKAFRSVFDGNYRSDGTITVSPTGPDVWATVSRNHEYHRHKTISRTFRGDDRRRPAHNKCRA